jgi:hypothetical protein
MEMDHLSLLLCRSLYKQLIIKPICRPFLTTSHPGHFCQFKIPPNLPTLEHVYQDLCSQKFTSIENFCFAIESFFLQVQNGASPIVADCVSDLLRWFGKKKNKLPKNLQKKNLSSVKRKLLQDYENNTTSPNEQKSELHVQIDDELIGRTIFSIKNPSTLENIAHIVNALEGGNQDEEGYFSISVEKCTEATKKYLVHFLTNHLQKQSKEVPQEFLDFCES